VNLTAFVGVPRYRARGIAVTFLGMLKGGLLLLLLFFGQARADDLWVSAMLFSRHYGPNSADLNEKNYGVGIEYAWAENARWVAGGYRDSHDQVRRYGGLTVDFPWKAGPVSVAIAMGLINGSGPGGPPGPWAFIAPMVKIEGDRLGANIFFAPPSTGTPGFVALQAKFRF